MTSSKRKAAVGRPARQSIDLTASTAALFRRDGPSGVTFRLVAEHAGVPFAGVRRHFGTKEEMLRHTVRRLADETAAMLAAEAAWLGTEKLPPAALADALSVFLAQADLSAGGQSTTLLELLLIALRTPTLRPEVQPVIDALAGLWTPAAGDADLGWYLAELAVGLLIASSGAGHLAEIDLLNAEVARRALLGRLPNGAFWFERARRHAMANPPELIIAIPSGAVATEIIRAAAAIFAAEGVDAVTYRNVAEQAGIPPSTVAYHFPTRASLVYAAHRQLADELYAHGEQLESKSGGRYFSSDPAGYFRDMMLKANIAARIESQLIGVRDPNCRPLAHYLRVVHPSRGSVGKPDSGIDFSLYFDAQVLNFWHFGCGLLQVCRSPPDELAEALRRRFAFGLGRFDLGAFSRA